MMLMILQYSVYTIVYEAIFVVCFILVKTTFSGFWIIVKYTVSYCSNPDRPGIIFHNACVEHVIRYIWEIPEVVCLPVIDIQAARSGKQELSRPCLIKCINEVTPELIGLAANSIMSDYFFSTQVHHIKSMLKGTYPQFIAV